MNDVYGVPKLALKVIALNAVLWIVAITILFVLSGAGINELPVMIVVLTGAVIFWLIAQFVLWKLYWWILGCSWSCMTFLYFLLILGILAGITDVPSLRSRLPF